MRKLRADSLRFRNMMRGNRDSRRALSDARETLPISLFPEMVRWLNANVLYAQRVFHPQYPQDIRQLNRLGTLEPVSVVRELRWAEAYLRPHADRLRAFETLAQSYLAAYMTDDMARCRAILDDVERQLGQSLWLIEHRVVLLQNLEGLESQKEYAATIRRETRRGSAPAFIAYYVSMRNEPSASPARFQTDFERYLDSLSLGGDYSAYLRHHINPTSNLAPETIADILRYEFNGTVVDYYEGLVGLVPSLVVIAPSELRPVVAQTLSSLYAATGDKRLEVALAWLGKSDEHLRKGSDASISGTAALLRGELDTALSLTDSALADDPTDPDAIVVGARAGALNRNIPTAQSGGVGRRLVHRLQRVLAREQGAAEDSSELNRFALNFYGTECSWVILTLLEDEIVSEPGPRATGPGHMAGLGISCVHPIRLTMLPAGQPKEQYCALLQATCADADATLYLLALEGVAGARLLPDGHLWEEEIEHKGRTALQSGAFGPALEAAERLEGSSYGYYARRGIRLGCRALLRLGRTRDAISHIVTSFVHGRIAHQMLPIGLAAREIVDGARPEFAGEVSVPILFDLHTQYVDRSFESERVFAYTEFLEAHGLSRPSQLRSKASSFDKNLLIYFLRYLCVESVMDRSGTFESSREVIEERLSVCRLLVELDEASSVLYHDEIKTLLRRLMVQKRMHQIEQSRVYVDIDSIKRTIGEELREPFNRYLALRRGRTVPEDEPNVREVIRRASAGDVEELIKLRLPRNEASELFESIVLRLRDEYVSSPEHGLDKYLSVRIRHGTLAAHLRRRVEAAKLITAREVGLPTYKRNRYWVDRMRHAAPLVYEDIAGRLGHFSREFDGLVDEVKGWIQIRKDVDGSGLFDFRLTVPLVRIMTELVTEQMTLEQFIDMMLEQFGVMLDKNLERVRSKITAEGKTRASQLLEGLASSIQALGGWADVGEITNAIHTANTEVKVEFDRVSTWFRRAHTTDDEPISIEEAVEISVEAVRTIVVEFDAQLRSDMEETVVLRSGLMAIFVDVFFIIFENIVRHGGRGSRAAAMVELSKRGDNIEITVRNEVDPSVVSKEARARVAKIKEDMQDERYIAAVSREGGTGFHKLQRILVHDLHYVGSSPELDFGFEEAKGFFVRFLVPFRTEQR